MVRWMVWCQWLWLGAMFAGCLHTRSVERGNLSHKERKYEQQAMEALGSGKLAEEAKVWKRLLRDYPSSKLSGKAHLRLGMLAYYQKQWKRASLQFAKARKSFLLPQERRYVLFFHAKSLFEEAQYPKIQPLLLPILTKLPRHQQRKSYRLLARASKKLKKAGDTFFWRQKLWGLLPHGEKKRRLRRELFNEIPKLNSAQLRDLLNKESGRLRFPFTFVAYRLALSLYDADKFGEAKKWLKKLCTHLPKEHRLYPIASRMYDEVRGVRRPALSHVIGVILPLTGKASSIGKIVRNGIELAVTNYPRVRLIYKDSQMSPARAAAAVNSLVKEHKAIAIFGPPMAKTASAAAKRAQRLGVPLFSITAKANFADLGSYIFRNNLTPKAMGRAVARYAFDKLRIRRLAVLYPTSKYGKLQARAFLDEIKKLGAVLGGAMEFEQDTQDFMFPVKMIIGTTFENAHILRVSKAKLKKMPVFLRKRLRKKMEKMLKPLVAFEGLFIAAPSLVASQIAAHLAYYNVGLKRPALADHSAIFSQLDRFRKVQLLGNNGWYGNDLFKAGERYVRGSVFCVRYFRKSFRSASRQFTQDYFQRFQKKPIHISAYAYDTMRILAHISSSGKIRTRGKFREALLKIRNFDGPTGPMQIKSNGETIAPIKFVMAYRKKFRLHGVLR